MGKAAVENSDKRFKRYRLRLRKEEWPVKEGHVFWGKPIGLYDFTEYDPSELVAGLRKNKLRLPAGIAWKLWSNDSAVEIWGLRVKDDTWVPVSPWLIKEQRATEHLIQHLPDLAAAGSAGTPEEGRLRDEAHAACVEWLISWLRDQGFDPKPEASYNEWGEKGRVDVHYFRKRYTSPRDARTECGIFEVWTQLDNVNEALGRLDEKVRVFPAVCASQLAMRAPNLTRGYFVVLATAPNVKNIQAHWETFTSKFTGHVSPGRTMELMLVDPVAGDIERILPAAPRRDPQQRLSQLARFPSKHVFKQAWKKKHAKE